MYVCMHFICLLNKKIVSGLDNVNFIGGSDKGSFISTEVCRYVYMYEVVSVTPISQN